MGGACARGRNGGRRTVGDARRRLRHRTRRFRIASITKPFTATLALATLSLAEPTGIWPEDVRVRHLLSHVSGFDCELPELGYEPLRGRRRRPRPLRRRAAVGAPPRRRRRRLVVREHRLLARGLARRRARGHDLRGGALARSTCSSRPGSRRRRSPSPISQGPASEALPGRYPRARRPSGGLTSTVDDLLRFGRWHLAQQRIRPDARRARHAGARRLRARARRRGRRRRRGLGPRRLVRRLPVVVPRRAGARTRSSPA